VALTPVFLLSGIGSLLNVFNTRLARVSDHAEHAAELLEQDTEGPDANLMRSHLRRLRHRTLALDAAIVMTAIGGAAACGAAFVLFIGALRDAEMANWLVVLFGVSLGCTVCALIAFLADSVFAWHGRRKDGLLPRPKAT